MNIKRLLTQDIKILNGYLLLSFITIMLVLVGYTSYALFSTNVEGDKKIELTTIDNTVFEFTYNKDISYYTFKPYSDGKYLVELFGGVNSSKERVYTKGEIYLEYQEELYIYLSDIESSIRIRNGIDADNSKIMIASNIDNSYISGYNYIHDSGYRFLNTEMRMIEDNTNNIEGYAKITFVE